MVFTGSEIHVLKMKNYFKGTSFQSLSLLKINVSTWKVNIVWITEIVLHLSFEWLYILRLSIKRESNFLSWIINEESKKRMRTKDINHVSRVLFCYCYVVILATTFNLSELAFLYLLKNDNSAWLNPLIKFL